MILSYVQSTTTPFELATKNLAARASRDEGTTLAGTLQKQLLTVIGVEPGPFTEPALVQRSFWRATRGLLVQCLVMHADTPRAAWRQSADNEALTPVGHACA